MSDRSQIYKEGTSDLPWKCFDKNILLTKSCLWIVSQILSGPRRNWRWGLEKRQSGHSRKNGKGNAERSRSWCSRRTRRYTRGPLGSKLISIQMYIVTTHYSHYCTTLSATSVSLQHYNNVILSIHQQPMAWVMGRGPIYPPVSWPPKRIIK